MNAKMPLGSALLDSQPAKPDTYSSPEMLTPSEQERLRDKTRATLDYARKAFAHLRPMKPGK